MVGLSPYPTCSYLCGLGLCVAYLRLDPTTERRAYIGVPAIDGRFFSRLRESLLESPRFPIVDVELLLLFFRSDIHHIGNSWRRCDGVESFVLFSSHPPQAKGFESGTKPRE